MSSRILVAVVGVPLVIVMILWAPDWAVCAALCALAGLAGLELQQCVSGERRGVMVVLSAALPVFTVLWGFLTPESPALLWTAEVMLLFAYAISQGGAAVRGGLRAGNPDAGKSGRKPLFLVSGQRRRP